MESLKRLRKILKNVMQKGNLFLVGTVAIETSEIISNYLTKYGVKHNVLNAKNHGREAEIILEAGQKGSVTIATNMAGRGTDIKLGEGVIEVGGLAVIGTERHESRRIDNQLRGRSGRQGDPGVTQFYLSLEDELMRRFGSDQMKVDDDEDLEWMIRRQFSRKWFRDRLSLHKDVSRGITSIHGNVYFNMMMYFVNSVKLFTKNEMKYLRQKIFAALLKK